MQRLFPGDSELALQMRGFDWSSTDLGPPERWPANLRVAVSLCLSSRFPVLIGWGAHQTVLYNGAFLPVLRDAEHHRALGRPMRESRAAIWESVGPMFESVYRTGRATGSDDVPLFPDRDLLREEVSFKFTCSPIFAEEGAAVQGVLCLVLDTTELALAEAALKTAREEIRTLKERLAQEDPYPEEESRTNGGFEEIVGQSDALRPVLKQVETVAPTDATVLIQGETGTGKELIARAIHNLSRRRERTFVKINCAAIPTGLLESELLGHEKGAFTGAISQRIGRFELAHQGTIFLDEVGEIPLELQAKLLRVLQERDLERLGGTRTIHVDVRLIAATNRDMRQMVADDEFRKDLFYRLNVFPIMLPPLRARPEDVPFLVWHFTRRHASHMNKTIDRISVETMAALCRYTWPGNIRELENLIERSVILSRGPTLEVPLDELEVSGQITRGAHTLEAVERDHIVRTLEECRWVIAGPVGAAARLGMKRSSLQYRMGKLDIIRPRERRGQ